MDLTAGDNMNALAVSIAVILFPGLIATVICDKIAVHCERWRAFKYSIYSFVFGVSAYAAVQLIYWLCELIACSALTPLEVWSIATSQQGDINLWEVLWASLLSPVIAAVATLVSGQKWLTRFAQWSGISNKYGDENLLSYYLNSQEIQYVYIRDPSINQTYADGCGSTPKPIISKKLFSRR
jgi:hypothetical protein